MTATKRSRLTEAEQIELIALWEQRELERVSPKLEAFRNPMRIKGAVGGRGAGAKSYGLTSLAVQKANYERVNVVCLREVQMTLEESVWKLFGNTIDRLRYSARWDVNKVSIDNRVTGSHVIFRGLSDITATNIKSLEDFDIFLLEEAQDATDRSLGILFPTMRKPGSELWFAMNPEDEVDPILARCANRDDALIIHLEPGPVDNPWWTAELQKEMEADFERDPELAEHIWHGAPRAQGTRAILTRTRIRAAMDRKQEPLKDGVIELGIDVARFGDDRSEIYKRQGLVVVGHEERKGADTQYLARLAWDMVDRNPKTAIKVDDTGVGGGVTDKLRDLGSKNVQPVNNGGKPTNETLYTTAADEQWFEMPIDKASIPDDQELMQELSGRQFKYTNDDRKKIESKDDFKKRYGRSPDKADALLLCFYHPFIRTMRAGPSAQRLGL
jgi:phage terminase large subunit